MDTRQAAPRWDTMTRGARPPTARGTGDAQAVECAAMLHRILLDVSHLEETRSRESAWREAIAERLDDLEQRLEGRFSEEEHGALFVEVPRTHPRFRDELALLADEHRRLLAEVRLLEADFRGAEFPLAPRLRELLSALWRHEEREREIANRTLRVPPPR